MAQRILVFESDPDFAGNVRTNFARLGAQVDVVADGNEGLERAVQAPPDLILLSIELPSMNGFLVCKKIKKNAQLKDIPLVIMSSDANAEEIFEQHKKLRTRAEDYIRKPIAFSDLLTRVQGFVAFNGVAVGPDATGVHTRGSNVDEEIDAFAESAFDSLVIQEELSEHPTERSSVRESSRPHIAAATEESIDLDEVEEIVESADEPDTAVGAKKYVPSDRQRRSSRPAQKPGPTATEETSGARPAPIEEALNVELRALEGKVSNLQAQLAQALERSANAERLEREVTELKSRAARGGGGGISSREFLDLREALNRKDKEILELKEQVGQRDKQLLDMRDQNLGLERGKADFEDRILDLEKQLGDAEEANATLVADKESANKRGEDLRQRAERVEGRARKIEEELDQARKQHQEELEGLTARNAEEVERLRDSHAQDAAQRATEHGAEIERLKAEHGRALRSERDSRTQEVDALRSHHAVEMERMREEHAAALQRGEDEQAVRIATMQAEHEEAMARRAAELTDERERAIEATRSELEADKKVALEGADRRREAELAKAQSAHEAALSSRVREMRDAHAAELQREQDTHSRELALLGRKLAETETTLGETQAILRRTEEERSELEGTLHSRTSERDALDAELRSARGRITELEEVKSEHEARIRSLEASERDYRARLERTLAKLARDEEILDRARRAMAIGLGLLEDQRQNGAEGS